MFIVWSEPTALHLAPLPGPSPATTRVGCGAAVNMFPGPESALPPGRREPHGSAKLHKRLVSVRAYDKPSLFK